MVLISKSIGITFNVNHLMMVVLLSHNMKPTTKLFCHHQFLSCWGGTHSLTLQIIQSTINIIVNLQTPLFISCRLFIFCLHNAFRNVMKLHNYINYLSQQMRCTEGVDSMIIDLLLVQIRFTLLPSSELFYN